MSSCSAIKNCKRVVKYKALNLCASHYAQYKRGVPYTDLTRKKAKPKLPRVTRRTTDRDALGRKWCTGHGDWAPEENFHRCSSTPDGFQQRCKDCVRDAKAQGVGRKQKFGITPEDFVLMVAVQKGKCLGCGQLLTSSAHVDHDHSCCPGESSCGSCVRGVLCRNCNTALGFVMDSIPVLSRMKEYLNNSTEIAVETQALREEYEKSQTIKKFNAENYPYPLPDPKSNKRECSFPTCSRKVEYTVGAPLCSAHYCQFRRGAELFEIGRARLRRSLEETSRRARSNRLWKNYQLTADMVDALVQKQGGCAICHKEEATWHVDHDHQCCPGKVTCGECVRGVLCKPCNQALGLLGDDVDTISQLMVYLEDRIIEERLIDEKESRTDYLPMLRSGETPGADPFLVTS